MLDNSASFTWKYDGFAHLLGTAVHVSLPDNVAHSRSVNAIWDTGASSSCIHTRVAQELALKPISKCKSVTAGGTFERNVYLLDIILPNNSRITNVTMTDGEMGEIDLLIGMDIIRLGDFAVTNKDGKTWMTFMVPSQKRLDFVEQLNKHKETKYQKQSKAKKREDRKKQKKGKSKKKKK